jgi:diphthamide biosynthesis methyltransferase
MPNNPLTKVHSGDNMFETTQDLLEFIENAKKAGIASFKIGSVEVQFSSVAMLEAYEANQATSVIGTEEKNTSKTLTDTLSAEDEEELLMWSAKT